MRKLSKKESEEVVTKVFLSEYLSEQKYVTEDRLEEILDSKNYVTKEWAFNMFERMNLNIEAYSKENRQHLDTVLEEHQRCLETLFERFDSQYVTRTEWNESKDKKYSV